MRAIAAALALGLAPAAFAQSEFSLGTGLNYSSGSYGGSDSTKVLSIPLTARYESGPWTLRGTIPYLRIEGPAVVPGVGRVENAGGSADTLLGTLRGSGRQRRAAEPDTVSGIGDSFASATYTVYGAGNRNGVGLSGRVKLPTGDETQGLGTGSTDFALSADAFQREDRNTYFAGIGYTFFGSSPIVVLEDVANGSLGLTHRLDDADSIGAAFDLRMGGSPGPAPQRELSGFWTHRIDRHWRTQAYLLKGFARGSPDWGAGFFAAYAF